MYVSFKKIVGGYVEVSVLPTLEEAKEYIFQMDLSHVHSRLVQIDGWTNSAAMQGIEQYRRYLFLKKKYGSTYPLPPSLSIDDVWHAHILHTDHYVNDTNKIFGSYLNHSPGGLNHGFSNKAKLYFEYKKMHVLFRKEFGQTLRKTKPCLIRRLIQLGYLRIKARFQHQANYA